MSGDSFFLILGALDVCLLMELGGDCDHPAPPPHHHLRKLWSFCGCKKRKWLKKTENNLGPHKMFFTASPWRLVTFTPPSCRKVLILLAFNVSEFSLKSVNE
jgi:hypothetical protein